MKRQMMMKMLKVAMRTSNGLDNVWRYATYMILKAALLQIS
jgi:hypothetical protein